MAVSLPPAPYKTPVVDRTGVMSNAWIGWFREMFIRIGGNVAPSNDELGTSADVTTLQNQVATLQTQVTVLEGLGQGRQL